MGLDYSTGCVNFRDVGEYHCRLRSWADRLLEDEVESLIAQTREEAKAVGREAAVEEKLGYFVRNVARTQYGTFRKQGFFIGSGVIEAGCKTIIGARRKQSGMFWSVPGVVNVLAFRCIHTSRRTANFWKHRLNQHAARNDTLPLAACTKNFVVHPQRERQSGRLLHRLLLPNRLVRLSLR